MDSRALGYFLAVVDAGGVTPAAAALHLAQPSLSQAIRKLEREVGCPLFHRVGRGLVLSAAGQALVSPARQVLRDLRTATESVQAVLGLQGGRLDIATLPTLAVDPVAHLAGRFRREHPAVTLRLVDPVDAAAVGDLVRSGDCELGVTDSPPPDPGLRTRLVGRQRLLVVLPPGSDPAGTPLRLDRAAELSWVASPAGTSTRTLLEQSLAAVGTTPRIAVETAHREAVVPLVLAGAGATLLPEPLAAEAARRGAVVRSTRPEITRDVALVHRDGPLSPAAAAFLRTTREHPPAPAPGGQG